MILSADLRTSFSIQNFLLFSSQFLISLAVSHCDIQLCSQDIFHLEPLYTHTDWRIPSGKSKLNVDLTCVYVASCVWFFGTPWPARLLCPWYFQELILEWVAIPTPGDLPHPRNWTCVSCIFHIGRHIPYHWAIVLT